MILKISLSRISFTISIKLCLYTNSLLNLTNAKVVFSGTNTENNTPDSYIAIGKGRYFGNDKGMVPTADGAGTFEKEMTERILKSTEH